MRTSALSLTVGVLLFAITLAGFDDVCAEPSKALAAQQALATEVRIDAERNHAGPLLAQVGGKDVRIADQAIAAWILENGQKIAYSAADGAGGYENEGQSLRLYDVPVGTHRKVLSAYYVIDQVSEFKTKGGNKALLVEMRDGGLGASHLAVVDPRRGQVFLRKQVKLLKRRGDLIVLGRFHEADWERMAGDMVIQPYKTERYDVNTLLRRPAVVQNPVHP